MSPRVEDGIRKAFWVLLGVSWAVTVWLMWDAMTTVPSAERLQESRLAAIPSPRTFLTATIFSGMELAVVLAALWPWRPRFYASRLGLTSLGVLTWFVTTTPMQLNRMDWVHRRWLAFLVVATADALLVLVIYRAVGLARGRGGDPA